MLVRKAELGEGATLRAVLNEAVRTLNHCQNQVTRATQGVGHVQSLLAAYGPDATTDLVVIGGRPDEGDIDPFEVVRVTGEARRQEDTIRDLQQEIANLRAQLEQRRYPRLADAVGQNLVGEGTQLAPAQTLETGNTVVAPPVVTLGEPVVAEEDHQQLDTGSTLRRDKRNAPPTELKEVWVETAEEALAVLDPGNPAISDHSPAGILRSLPAEKLLTVLAAYAYTTVPPKTWYYEYANDQIQGVRLGPQTLRFTVGEVLRYIGCTPRVSLRISHLVYWKIPQLAQRLGVNDTTVGRLIMRGALPAVRTKDSWRIYETDIAPLLEERYRSKEQVPQAPLDTELRLMENPRQGFVPLNPIAKERHIKPSDLYKLAGKLGIKRYSHAQERFVEEAAVDQLLTIWNLEVDNGMA